MATIKTTLFLAIYFITTVATAQYIIVDDTRSDTYLVQQVLVNSSCANVSGSVGTGDEYTSGEKSYGYFNAGNSTFPLKEGIFLSTSTSKNAIGPYVSDERGGGDKRWKGDDDLDQTLGIKSTNATVLEFDFIPLTNYISFNYIFASNEYQTYFPCEFSDGFAFLIKEKNSAHPYKNIAVLPGTNTPVSSKNVHPVINSFVDSYNITHAGCDALNENYFNGYNSDKSPINYSAQTIKLNAQTEVIAGKTYHIKLVIADDGPEYYDSTVFLEAGSFSAKMDLGPDRTAANSTPICFGESYNIDTQLSPIYSYEWYKNGAVIPISGENKPSLTVTSAGTYKVKVLLNPSICTAEDEIKIEYVQKIILNDATLYQCDEDMDGMTVFNLSQMDNFIKNNDPKLSEVVYYTSKTNAQGEINPIINPSSFQNTIINQKLYARVSNDFGCVNYAELYLVVANNTISTQNPIEVCDADNIQDGMTQIDLNTIVTPKIIEGLPAGLIVEYYSTLNDAMTQTKQLPNLYTNTIAKQQIIYARIVNGTDCYKITPITLLINTFDPTNFEDATATLCNGSSTNLTIASDFVDYLWSTGDKTNTINVNTAGPYSVTVKDVKSCQKTKEYIVNISEIATITSAKSIGFAGVGNSVDLSYSGNGRYEFSLDGNLYQDSTVFNSLNSGIYWATARDKNGCGISDPYRVCILDYPRFFTPNNDGYNDVWKIKNLETLPNSTVRIFDRYGKLLKQMPPASEGWDGVFNGTQLPADDYWFTLTFEDGETIKGHFSLKR